MQIRSRTQRNHAPFSLRGFKWRTEKGTRTKITTHVCKWLTGKKTTRQCLWAPPSQRLQTLCPTFFREHMSYRSVVSHRDWSCACVFLQKCHRKSATKRELLLSLSVFFSNGHAGRGYPPLKWTSLEKNTSCSLRVGDKNERNSKEQEIRRKGPSPCYSFALRFLSWSAPRWCDFAHVECILVQQS